MAGSSVGVGALAGASRATLAALWGRGKKWASLLCAAYCLMCAGSSGCVETADCDASTQCETPASQVCYNYRCVPRCGVGGRCATGLICVPCGTVSPCPGDPQASACVEVP
jgi:hypothetical protein